MTKNTIRFLFIAVSMCYYVQANHYPTLSPTPGALKRLQRQKTKLMSSLEKNSITDLEHHNIALALKIAEEKANRSNRQSFSNDLNLQIKTVGEQINELQKLIHLQEKHTPKDINKMLQKQQFEVQP